MQPNEQPQHPIDYLDSIATTPRQPAQKVSDKLFFGAIVAGLLLALFVGTFALSRDDGGSKEDLSRLNVRLENLRSISDKSRKNIVSSSLRGTNTNLSFALTNASRDLEEHLTKHDIDPKKISSKITDQEKTKELEETLEDARLNAIFDRTYAREMTYQLETLTVFIKQIEEDTKNTSEKEFLSTTLANLEPLQNQFANFDAATS